jgi:gliding motility-associated-like protein
MLNRRFVLTLLLLSSLLQAKSQIIQVSDATTPPFTPENLIKNYFLGEGIEVLSVKYEGAPEAIGYFNNAKGLIGIDRGILLTNGRAQTTGSGSNIRFGVDAASNNIANNDNLNNPKDNDIDKIIATSVAPNVKSTNLSKYTITFIPSADTLRFRYVFASEEYPEYICQNYNDIFGFFISGPGINGTFENNGQNIALIPNTNLPVSINNINLGNSSFANCPPKFPQYYNNNNNTGLEPVYDAFLDVFIAQAVVQPCQVYTIKLVIADLEDSNYDSAVFLEAKSFGTGTIKVDRLTQASDNTVIEGCLNGAITFKLPKIADKDTPLKCNIIGTAQNGVDYKRIQTNLFVPKGDSVLTIKIEGLADAISEGTETIGFDIQRDVCKRDTFWFFIKDNEFNKTPRRTINDTTICKGQELKFDATVFATFPPNPKFENRDSIAIATIIPNSTNTPTIVPITVANVAPTEFNPSIIESVCVNLRHPWIDDIDLYLIAPSGQFIALSTDNGGAGDNMFNTCFKPTATNDIRGGTAPFSGDWLPEESFGNLVSTTNNTTNGVWKLLAIDDQPAGFTGRVLNWSITFKSNYKIDYQWNTNQNISCSNCPTPTISPKANFDYQVEIKDVYGCKFRDTANVILLDSLAAPSVLCGVTTHTNVTFAWLPIPDAKGYEISLNGGAWQDVGNDVAYKVSNLNPNTNTSITVRGKGGICNAKETTKTCVTLPCATVMPAIDFINQVSCAGKQDGTVNIIVTSGGTPPYTYTMPAQSNANGSFKNLAPGIYKVSITDANTCAATVEFEIVEPAPLQLELLADSTTCTNSADAVALATVEGGTMPYLYKWSNGASSELNDKLKKGTYILTVEDARGCIMKDSIVVYEPSPLKLRLSKSDPSCFEVNDGSARAVVESGGTAPFEYLWETNLGKQPTSKVIGLSPGIHRVTATDARGCTVSGPIFINAPQKIGISITTTSLKCYGENNATIDVALNGGTSPYQYKWSNGDTLPSLKSLAAGSYFLTATDKNNCLFLDTITIQSPDSLKIVKQNRQHIRCYGETNGRVEIEASGGNGAYQYLWSNNNTSRLLDNIGAGIYTITVSDGNACIKKDSVQILQPDSLSVATTVDNLDCKNPNSGKITVVAQGGSPPYAYTWQGANNFTSTDTIIENLPLGIYTLTLTDSKACSKIISYEITTPTPFEISGEVTPVKCKGDATGSIILNINGGNAPFNFVWSNQAITKDNLDLIAGNYSVTVSDASSCSIVKSYLIEEPTLALNLQISGIDTLCFDAKNGTLIASVLGGTTPYRYEWNNGFIDSFLVNISGGNFSLSVTDNNGCKAIAQRNIATFGKIEAKISEIQAKCHDSKDAVLEITEISYSQVSTPISDFLLRWSNGENTPIASQLIAGATYSVTITNKRGCTAVESVKLFKPTPPQIILLNTTNPSCDKGNDGMLEINGAGGKPPYLFEWSNGSVGAKIEGLSEGDFVVTMTDANACAASVFFTLKKAKPFTLTTEVSPQKCNNTKSGAAKLNIAGGLAPFSIRWSTGETSASIQNLAVGSYSYTVSDAAGCRQVGSIKIDSAIQLVATYTTTPISCGGAANGSFLINPKGGTPPYMYSVDNKPFNAINNLVGLRAGIYEVLVKDANSCLVSLSIPIIQPEPIKISIGNDTTLVFGEQYSVFTKIENAFGTIKYAWFPDDTTLISCFNCKNPILKPKITTLYTVNIQDSIGCKATASIQIALRIDNKIFVPSGFSPNEDGENDRLLVHGDKDAIVLNFEVFDRWGEKVFSDTNFNPNDPNRGWDGYFRNVKMPSGTYAYSLRVKFKNGAINNFKGIVNLIK